jgi:hypothetical protein
MSDELTKEEIAEQAEPISQLIIQTALGETESFLTLVVALEAAKLAIMHAGRVHHGADFTEQAEELLESFDGFDEVAEALSDGTTFMQPGGES